jgi:tetratricopeptide (TPR) repeat protein
MLNLIVKIVLGLASLGWAIYQFSLGEIGNGIFFTFLSAIFIFFIFRNETLLRAFWFIRKGDMTKANKILRGIKDPKYMMKSQQAYYYYLLALSMSQDRGIFEAEKYFKKALNTGLRMKHDQAMAKLSLATAAMSRRRKKEATMLLNEAKKLDKNNLLADQIKMMKEQMKRI